MQRLRELDAIVDRLDILLRSTTQDRDTPHDHVDIFLTRVWMYIAFIPDISLNTLETHFLSQFTQVRHKFISLGDAEFQHSFIASANHLFGEANAALFSQLLQMWESNDLHGDSMGIT